MVNEPGRSQSKTQAVQKVNLPSSPSPYAARAEDSPHCCPRCPALSSFLSIPASPSRMRPLLPAPVAANPCRLLAGCLHIPSAYLRIQVLPLLSRHLPRDRLWAYLSVVVYCLLNYGSAVCITWQPATELPLSCSLTSDSKVLRALASTPPHLEPGCVRGLHWRGVARALGKP